MPYVVQQFIELKEISTWLSSGVLPTLDVVFLKKMLKTVDELSLSQPLSMTAILGGVISTIARRYPQCAMPEGWHQLHPQKAQVEAFVQFMMQAMFEDHTTQWLQTIEDSAYAISFFRDAIGLYTELSRAEFTQALEAKPTLKMTAPLSFSSSFEHLRQKEKWMDVLEWTQHDTIPDETDITEIWLQYERFFLSKEPTFFKEIVHKSPFMLFFESSMRALLALNCSNRLKQGMVHGLMKSLAALFDADHSACTQAIHFNGWLKRQIHHLEKHASCFSICQISIAAYLLLQLHMFDGGTPKNGRTVLPCFGLEDVDMWRYSQAVLKLFEQAASEWGMAGMHVSRPVYELS